MKSLTCNQVGGACDTAFTGATLEEISEACKTHVMENMDEAHKAKMDEMMAKSEEERKAAWEEWQKLFDAAPDVE